MSAGASAQFTSVANIGNILVQISVLTVISSGLAVSGASGEFGLSVGQVAGLSGVLAAGLIVWSGLPIALAIALSVLAGVAIGVVNGPLSTRLRIPSLIATLAMGPVALGANYACDGGDPINAYFPQALYVIATGRAGGVVPVLVAVVVVAAFYVLVNRTRLGRAVVATGSSLQAARLSGIDMDRCRLVALTLSALGVAMGGVMLTARLGTGQPGAGEPYLLEANIDKRVGPTALRRLGQPAQRGGAGLLPGL